MPPKLMLRSSAAAIAILTCFGTRAFAACVETAPGSGIYTCSGSDPGPTFIGQSVTINADPTASFTSDVIVTGPGTSVLNNRGTLTNGLVATSNDSFTLNNHGLIDGNISLNGSGTNFIVNFGDGTVQNGVTGSGTSDDTVLNNGYFAGSISLGDGNDTLGLLAGTVQTSVDMGPGNDNFTWVVGNVAATVQMGSGNDTANFVALTQSNLTAGKIIDGGSGTDTLNWRGSSNDDGSGSGDHPSNLVNWETINLTSSSRMTFIYTTGVLTLGDAASGTGTISIDSTSRINAGNSYGYGIVPFASSRLVTVNNAGVIDLTNDTPYTGTSLHDTFSIKGNYIGQNGQLWLHTYLGTDGSPSDRLIIDTGQASGSTGIRVVNIDGQGDLTNGDGIRVIDAINSGRTTGSAFSLVNPVGAGPFEYFLYRGGVSPSADTDNDWFLRNTIAPSPPSPPSPPLPPSPPAPPPPPIPNIRPEVPGQIIAPLVAQRMGLMTMGSFHQRRGDQSFLTGVGALVYSGPGAQGDADEGDGSGPPVGTWGRIFGANSDLGADASLSIAGYQIGPQFNGDYWGIQVGSDIAEIEHGEGHVERFGLFYTHANTSGDISANVLGRTDISAGTLDLSEDSVAAYWTSLSKGGWYVDAVAKFGWLNGTSRSNRGIESDVDGTSFAASLETGLPIDITENWTIEPQAQIIWQNFDFDDSSDRFSSITSDSFDAFTGRIGARLQYSTGQSYAHFGVNLWHGFSADETVRFGKFPLVTEVGGTWLEMNLGGAYEINETISAFGDISYSFDLDGAENRMIAGQVGMRFKW